VDFYKYAAPVALASDGVFQAAFGKFRFKLLET
jgi:hypothetical protein